MNTRAAYYVDCCGRAKATILHYGPLVTRHQQHRYEVAVGPLAPVMTRCPVCLGQAALVTIKVKQHFGEAPGCDARCLNGKTTCDCRCKGRCHGAGQCLCAVA